MNNKLFSNAQEKRVAKQIGGRKTANSGATRFSKGDVVNKEWIIEAKTKTKPQRGISISKSWLDKIKEESYAMNKAKYALYFDFGDEEGYYIIDEKIAKKCGLFEVNEEVKQ